MEDKSDKTRTEAARQRWLYMSEEERRKMAQSIGDGMKNLWATRTREQRLAIARKAAASRRANRLKGKTK